MLSGPSGTGLGWLSEATEGATGLAAVLMVPQTLARLERLATVAT